MFVGVSPIASCSRDDKLISMSNTPPDYLQHWIAVEIPQDSTIYVFGPYTVDGAAAERTQFLTRYPSSVRISQPFAAESYSVAEQSACLFLRSENPT